MQHDDLASRVIPSGKWRVPASIVGATRGSGDQLQRTPPICGACAGARGSAGLPATGPARPRRPRSRAGRPRGGAVGGAGASGLAQPPPCGLTRRPHTRAHGWARRGGVARVPRVPQPAARLWMKGADLDWSGRCRSASFSPRPLSVREGKTGRICASNLTLDVTIPWTSIVAGGRCWCPQAHRRQASGCPAFRWTLLNVIRVCVANPRPVAAPRRRVRGGRRVSHFTDFLADWWTRMGLVAVSGRLPR